MSQGNIAGGFLAVHRDIADFHLQVKGDDMKAAQLGAAAGHSLDFRDHPAAYVVLKGLCGRVPEPDRDGEGHAHGGQQQVFPPAPTSGGRFAHRDSIPSSGGSPKPGRLTLLSARNDCSHEAINSLTFSWVSSSRIFGDTSARVTGSAPDSFNCGTNLSR